MPWASWFDGSPPRQVVVVRALPGLGDLLCVVPALRALRAALPEARIDLLRLSTALEFVQRFSHYVDHLIEFPGFPGIPERPPAVRHLPAFLDDMHRKHYDVALQMHGNGTVSNSFTLLLGARHTAGFYLPSLYCPDPEQFTLMLGARATAGFVRPGDPAGRLDAAFPLPVQGHEVERALAFVRFLGAPAV